MKAFPQFLCKTVVMVCLLLSTLEAHSQTTVSVDSAKPWIGYMNVFELPTNGGAYAFGQPWGTADLVAFFDSTLSHTLTLGPCTNVWETKDTFWVQADGFTANKSTDASMYVQDDTLAGQSVTFLGNCLTYTLSDAYSCTAFIKDFSPSYSLKSSATATLAAGQPFNIFLATSAGDHIQYGFETIGPDANPTNQALGSVVLEVNNVDPSISTLSGQALVEGQNATLGVTATGTAPFAYSWSLVNQFGTTSLSDGGRIAGATTGTLIISNVQPDDAGDYFVTVSNKNGTNTANAPIVVIPLAQAQTNMLIDPGFEANSFSPSAAAGWVSFNGAAFENTNQVYYGSSEPVTVNDGMYCLEVYNGGAYNGAYQERPALPGHVYTAGIWFQTPSGNQLQDPNTCILEVQFRDAGGNVLVDYQSSPVTSSTPADTWIYFQPTNIYAGDFTTFLGTSDHLVSPPNTALVRYQITLHAAGSSGGEVDVDSANLKLRAPTMSVATSADRGSFRLSFPTLFGPTYKILFKNNLTDAAWQTLTTVSGDGTVKTIVEPLSAKERFYLVNTL